MVHTVSKGRHPEEIVLKFMILSELLSEEKIRVIVRWIPDEFECDVKNSVQIHGVIQYCNKHTGQILVDVVDGGECELVPVMLDRAVSITLDEDTKVTKILDALEDIEAEKTKSVAPSSDEID